MAFADPLVMTFNAVATDLNRISTSENKSVYRSADGLQTATISHFYGKRNRHVFRLDLNVIDEDPYDPTTFRPYSASATLTVDGPVTGIDNTTLLYMVNSLCGEMTESSSAQAIKFLGGQN